MNRHVGRPASASRVHLRLGARCLAPWIAWVLSATVVLSTAASQPAIGPLLQVPNAGFEVASPFRIGRPAGYSTYTSPGTNAEFRWDHTEAHGGVSSVHIHNEGPETAAWYPSQGVRCVPYARYIVRVWVKTRQSTGFAGLSIRYRDGQRRWLGPPLESPDHVQGTSDWVQVRYLIAAPPGAETFEVFLTSARTAGSDVWFDDLSIEDASTAAAIATVPRLLQQMAALRRSAPAGLPSSVLRPTALAALADQGSALLERARSSLPGPVAPEDAAAIADRWLHFTRTYRKVVRDVALSAAAREWLAFKPRSEAFLVGWQSSLERVWLRDEPTEIHVWDAGSMDAVRGETEAIQLVVAALRSPLRHVNVRAGDLTGPRGLIPSSNIQIHPVGYVHVTTPQAQNDPASDRPWDGWWPDILLDPVPFDVALGETQAVWLSVTVPYGTEPGNYTAAVEVSPTGEPPVELKLAVRVWNCDLPRTWHLRNVMSFHEHFARQLYGNEWTPQLRRKFLDFLTARRINLTSIYGTTEFSWEEISRAVSAGQNTIVVGAIPPNAGLPAPPTQAPWLSPRALDDVSRSLDEWVPRLKSAGILDKALLYGFDEVGSEWFQAASHVLRMLKERHSNVATISTLFDSSYGIDSGLSGAVDNFVPLMTSYQPTVARVARSGGTRVWWYETVWNLEQPLPRSRLIPWQTFKMGADGFLVWCLNRWVGGDRPGLPKPEWKWNAHPVANEVQSAWNPWLDGVSPNSSAIYVYPGVAGPLSSARLECFRDGIEDYDLLCEARDRLAALRSNGRHQAAIRMLERALTLEDDTFGDRNSIDVRPSVLLEHRRRLIEALVATNDDARR